MSEIEVFFLVLEIFGSKVVLCMVDVIKCGVLFFEDLVGIVDKVVGIVIQIYEGMFDFIDQFIIV